MAATASTLSPYEVVSDAGLTLGKIFYRKGARLGLTPDQAFYLELSGSVRSLADLVLDPPPVYVPPVVGPITPTESNTLVQLTVSGLSTFVTIENLVNLFPKLRPARGLTGDRGEKGEQGEVGPRGPSVVVNGHSGDSVVVTKSDVGLGNVENIAPQNMPVSTQQAQAIASAVAAVLDQVASGGDVDLSTLSAIVASKASKAELASALTTALTQLADGASSNANTLGKLETLVAAARAATTAVDTRVSGILSGSNAAVDTFIEVYNKFVADESAAAALTAVVGTKANQADLVGLAVDTLDAVNGKADLSVVTALAVATLDAVSDKLDKTGDASQVTWLRGGSQTSRSIVSRFQEGSVSLEDFKAASDLDDTAGLQRAHDFFGASGGVVELPLRDITVSGQVAITNPIWFRGKGWSETAGTKGTRILLPSITQSPFNISGIGSKGVAFTNLSIAQTAHPNPTAGWAPAAYPPVFDCQNTGGALILDNVMGFGISKLVNSFNSGRTYLHRIYGHFFDYLLQTDQALDAARIDQIHCWPFWSLDNNVHIYTQANLLGLKFYRCDTPFIDNFFMIFGRSALWFGDRGNGAASRVRAGKIQADGCAAGVIVDASANYVDAYIADLDVQGIQIGTAATGINGSCAIRVDGSNNSLRFGHMRGEYTGGSAIVVGGQGNRLDIATPYFARWASDGINTTAPAVSVGNSNGLLNAVRFGGTPRFDGQASLNLVNGSTNAIFDGFPPLPFTTTVSAATGALGSYTAIGTYRRRGAEVSYDLDITIGNNGTGAAALIATLPAIVADAHAVAYGSEFATSGLTLAGRTQAGTQTLSIVTASNGYPVATGSVLHMQGRFTPVYV